MELKPIKIDIKKYPAELWDLLLGAKIFDSSCSKDAAVVFIDRKDGGLFLKSAAKGTLQREADMTRYFHNKGLSAEVITYISDERDWLLTAKIEGEDCVSTKYLFYPKRLCDILAEQLSILHNTSFKNCPMPNHTERFIEKAERNYRSGFYNRDHFPDSWGYKSAEEAYNIIKNRGHLLKTDTLLHGDFCLPNIILNNWKFSGFIDLDNSGVGDAHLDLFWATWTLVFNLKTNEYRERFIDAYGRSKVDEEKLRVVAAFEVFG